MLSIIVLRESKSRCKNQKLFQLFHCVLPASSQGGAVSTFGWLSLEIYIPIFTSSLFYIPVVPFFTLIDCCGPQFLFISDSKKMIARRHIARSKAKSIIFFQVIWWYRIGNHYLVDNYLLEFAKIMSVLMVPLSQCLSLGHVYCCGTELN